MSKPSIVEQAKSSTVHSVVVTVRVLEYLAESGRPQRVTDIAADLGITKARVSRHLSTLADMGLVAKTPEGAGYRLGPTLFRLSNAALDQYEITTIAHRHMINLRNRVSEAVLIAIPAGGDAMVVATVGSGKPMTPQLLRGTRYTVPVSPTARVILAFHDDHVRERVLARRMERDPNRENVFNPADLRANIAAIRQRFYEFEIDPHDAGFSVISAPVFDHAERIEAALTIVMTRSSDPINKQPRFVQPLLETAVDISRALGSQSMADKMAAAA